MTISDDTFPAYVFSFYPDGSIQSINNRMCAALGYDSKELTGAPLDRLLPMYSRIFLQTHLMPLLALQGFAYEIFLTFIDKNNKEVPVLLNLERETTSQAITYTAVGLLVQQRKEYEKQLLQTKKTLEKAIRDNTELRQAEEALLQRTRELDNSLQQLNTQHEELSQFSKVLTHDLQEPLRKLALFSDLLEQSSSSLSSATLTFLKNIRRASMQMHGVVKGLQQYIWLMENEEEKTSVDLATVTGRAREIVAARPAAPAFTVSVSGLQAVPGHADQLVRLFVHLMENAVQFQPEGQQAIIRIEGRLRHKNSFLHMSDQYEYQQYLEVRVSDNGVGFDAGQKHHVFNIFSRLHDESGKGLGLAFSRKIVNNHHGRISAESEVNKGTTITILFPLFSLATEKQQ